MFRHFLVVIRDVFHKGFVDLEGLGGNSGKLSNCGAEGMDKLRDVPVSSDLLLHPSLQLLLSVSSPSLHYEALLNCSGTGRLVSPASFCSYMVSATTR